MEGSDFHVELEREMEELFPDDIMMNVLLRSSVKSILRFRCVSKTWLALIDSNDFVKEHLNRSIITKTNQNLILHRYNHHDLFSVSLDSLDQALQIVPPIKHYCSVTNILGSCNGLLCLYGTRDYGIIIWNLATRKHVNVPDPVIENSFSIDIVHGFGYDLVSDDYKLVMLYELAAVHGRYLPYPLKVNVYNLRSNSWRKSSAMVIQGYYFSQHNYGALACGALHWIMSKRHIESVSFSYLVGAFDLKTEEYMKIELPNIPTDEVSDLSISELSGCLSFVCVNFRTSFVDVWVMKNYGARESWTRLLSFSRSEIAKSRSRVFPLLHSESGDEVLMVLNFEEFLWYNLQKRTVRFVDVLGLPNPFSHVICLETLVSLGDNAEND